MSKKNEDSDESSGGFSLDDAFDDDDVEYAETKPKPIKKKIKTVKDISRDSNEDGEVILKGSKPISEIKKGDKMKIDGLDLEVDSHYIMIDHGNTKEMAIELFDSKSDKDYQLRYFDDNVENSIEFYELEEIIYSRKSVGKVSW